MHNYATLAHMTSNIILTVRGHLTVTMLIFSVIAKLGVCSFNQKRLHHLVSLFVNIEIDFSCLYWPYLLLGANLKKRFYFVENSFVEYGIK